MLSSRGFGKWVKFQTEFDPLLKAMISRHSLAINKDISLHGRASEVHGIAAWHLMRRFLLVFTDPAHRFIPGDTNTRMKEIFEVGMARSGWMDLLTQKRHTRTKTQK